MKIGFRERRINDRRDGRDGGRERENSVGGSVEKTARRHGARREPPGIEADTTGNFTHGLATMGYESMPR